MEAMSRAELEQEAQEHEFGASFDDVRERFSGDLSPCWLCGVLTVDAGGHCEDRSDEGNPELPRWTGGEFGEADLRSNQRESKAPWESPAATVRLARPIRLTYSTIDRYREVRTFKTLQGARAYAKRRMGTSFDLGSTYAVTFDGVGKLEADGISLGALLEIEG